MDAIKEELGRMLSVRYVADYLNLDMKTVRKYYSALGGVRLWQGGRIVFFERRLIDALSKHEHKQERIPVDGTGQNKREEKKEAVQNQKRGTGLGGGAEETPTRRNFIDRHNLLT